MSLEAITWASKQFLPPPQKILLLTLAEFMGSHSSRSIDFDYLCRKTSLSLEIVKNALCDLSYRGLLFYESLSNTHIEVGLFFGKKIPNASSIVIKRMSGSRWQKLKKIVFARDNYLCRYCGIETKNPHCDHIIPLARKGTDDINNLATACFKCNNAKGKKLLEEWKR